MRTVIQQSWVVRLCSLSLIVQNTPFVKCALSSRRCLWCLAFGLFCCLGMSSPVLAAPLAPQKHTAKRKSAACRTLCRTKRTCRRQRRCYTRRYCYPKRECRERVICQEDLYGDRACQLHYTCKTYRRCAFRRTCRYYRVCPAHTQCRKVCRKAQVTKLPCTMSQLERAVFALTNKERVARGLQALRCLSRLQQAARAWSYEQCQRGGLSHVAMSQRFRTTRLRYSYIGENVAAGQRTPEAVMMSWMKSPGHRRNILRPVYTHLGIGFIRCKKGMPTFWTQMFLKQAR